MTTLALNMIHNLDALEGISRLPEESVQLVIADPPYNIGKADWDEKWKDVPEYIRWCGKWIRECERVLKPNGSLYIFHNDEEQIAELMVWIKKNTRFKFRRLITWNKRYCTRKSKTFVKSNYFGYFTGFLEVENLRNYQRMSEYILFYTFDNGYRIREERKKRGLSQKDIAKEVLSKTDGITGWVSNVEKGLSYPNQEQMAAITKHLGLTEEQLIPKFHNLKNYHSVWCVDIADREEHDTPKPRELTEIILSHSSDAGDLVLIPFSGGGNAEVACRDLGRDFVSFEIEPKYVEAGMKKVRNRQMKIFEYRD